MLSCVLHVPSVVCVCVCVCASVSHIIYKHSITTYVLNYTDDLHSYKRSLLCLCICNSVVICFLKNTNFLV